MPKDSIVAQINIDMIGRGRSDDLPGGNDDFLGVADSPATEGDATAEADATQESTETDEAEVADATADADAPAEGSASDEAEASRGESEADDEGATK